MQMDMPWQAAVNPYVQRPTTSLGFDIHGYSFEQKLASAFEHTAIAL